MDFLSKITNKKKIALITEDGKSLTYGQLLKSIHQFHLLFNKRSLIFVIAGNNFETIASYYGSLKSNCVVALIDENLSVKLLKNLILKYKPNFIFIDKNKKKIFKYYDEKFNFYNYVLFEKKNNNTISLNKNLHLLISTSGSTGSSKFVKISDRNIINNTLSIIKYLKISKNDKAITTLPISYVYGLSVINTHLKSGATIVLNNSSIIEKNFWEKLSRYKITNFAGVPYLYEILDRIDFKKFDLRYLKYTTQAGGKLQDKIIRNIIKKYKKFNLKLLIMYGAAEATARMSYLPWSKIESKIGSAGIAIPGGKFWIEDKKKNRIRTSKKIGEIVYQGNNVHLGYAKNQSDLAKGDENKNILRTGDIGYLDKDKFLYIIGRKDRFVKVYGQRVNLSELEEMIYKIGIKCLCFQETSNKIAIYIKRLKDKKKILNFLKNSINLHTSIFIVKTIKKFPRNLNYKISYDRKLLSKK